MILADTPFGVQPTNPFPKYFQQGNSERKSIQLSINLSETNKFEEESTVTSEIGRKIVEAEQLDSDNAEKTSIEKESDIKPTIKPKSICEAGLKTDIYSKRLPSTKVPLFSTQFSLSLVP